MPSQRSLSWSAALADLRADRTARPEVREEILRTASGLRGEPALALSAWRGRSGRRYVVAVHDLSAAALRDLDQVVAAAVRRDEQGVASIVSATDQPSADWIAAALAAGGQEIHVHRLAETEAARAAAVADLRPLPN